jgi:hypothetical protein
VNQSGVRAEWHLADLGTVDEDPFNAVVYSAGIDIDLTAPEEELGAKLVELMRLEERLYNRGLTCDLKWAGQDCRSCTQATLDPTQDRSNLCRLGKDQCTVEAQYTKLRDARLAPVEELAEKIDDVSELGVLPDDLAELLMQVDPTCRC